MKNILVDMPVDSVALAYLRSIQNVQVSTVEPQEETRQLASELLNDTHILFCTTPPENFFELASLELIQICSTGYSQLYGLGLVERGVRACNGRGNFDVPIAEWVISMMVNLKRNLRQMIRNQEKRIWDRSASFQCEIRGSVVGLWGYGGIGRETARLAKNMGMTIHVLSRHREVGTRFNVYTLPGTGDPDGVLPDRVFTLGEEEEFLGGLDFLVLAIPCTKRTEGIIGERELRALRPTAYVLNPARGPLIKEEALLKALQEKWFMGTALDAHYYYPMPPDHPLWYFSNVIMTPHISGSSQSTWFLKRSWDIFTRNVERHLSGRPLLNELTPAQLLGD